MPHFSNDLPNGIQAYIDSVWLRKCNCLISLQGNISVVVKAKIYILYIRLDLYIISKYWKDDGEFRTCLGLYYLCPNPTISGFIWRQNLRWIAYQGSMSTLYYMINNYIIAKRMNIVGYVECLGLYLFPNETKEKNYLFCLFLIVLLNELM